MWKMNDAISIGVESNYAVKMKIDIKNEWKLLMWKCPNDTEHERETK